MKIAMLQFFGLPVTSENPIADISALLQSITTKTVARDRSANQDGARHVRDTQSCPATPFTDSEPMVGNNRLSILNLVPSQTPIQGDQVNMAPPTA